MILAFSARNFDLFAKYWHLLHWGLNIKVLFNLSCQEVCCTSTMKGFRLWPKVPVNHTIWNSDIFFSLQPRRALSQMNIVILFPRHSTLCIYLHSIRSFLFLVHDRHLCPASEWVGVNLIHRWTVWIMQSFFFCQMAKLRARFKWPISRPYNHTVSRMGHKFDCCSCRLVV